MKKANGETPKYELNVLQYIENEISKINAFRDYAYSRYRYSEYAARYLTEIIDDDDEYYFNMITANEGYPAKDVIAQYLKIREIKKQYPDYFISRYRRELYPDGYNFFLYNVYINVWKDDEVYMCVNESKETILNEPEILQLCRENGIDILFEDYTRLSDGKKMSIDREREWGSADDAYSRCLYELNVVEE